MVVKTENSLRAFILTLLATVIAGFIVYAYQDEVKSLITKRNTKANAPSTNELLQDYKNLTAQIEELSRKRVRDEKSITKLTKELEKVRAELLYSSQGIKSTTHSTTTSTSKRTLESLLKDAPEQHNESKVSQKENLDSLYYNWASGRKPTQEERERSKAFFQNMKSNNRKNDEHTYRFVLPDPIKNLGMYSVGLLNSAAGQLCFDTRIYLENTDTVYCKNDKVNILIKADNKIKEAKFQNSYYKSEIAGYLFLIRSKEGGEYNVELIIKRNQN
jgi:hypothetical protein